MMIDHAGTVVHEVTVDCHGFDIAATISLHDDGPSVDQMIIRRRIGGPAITGTSLRAITVEAIVRSEMQKIYHKSIVLAELTPSEARRMTRSGPTDETIGWVGRVYNFAKMVGDPPNDAVKRTFGVSLRTAGGWIGRARAAGHVSPFQGATK